VVAAERRVLGWQESSAYGGRAYRAAVAYPGGTALRGRISGVGGNMPAAVGNYHPVADMIMTQPMTRVAVTADKVQVEQVTPLWAGPRGDTIPATARGQWFQLYAAGRA
jgi:hypothetical protein